MGFIIMIGMLVFGAVQIYAGFLGIDFYFGAVWAWLAIVAMFMTRISLPLTIGAFFGALHVWHWPWYGALAFAAPGVVHRHHRHGALAVRSGQGKGPRLMPLAVIYAAAAMLGLGALPLPYGYYMLLRLVGCSVFVAAAVIAHGRGRNVLPWVYGLVALLFNPFFKVHFDKEVWAALDVGAALLLLATAGAIRAKPTNSQAP